MNVGRRIVRRWRLILGVGAALLAAGFAATLVGFIRQADRTAPVPAHADGIVALTGGAERVETALHLLAGGHATWLLISGIGGGTELGDLTRRAGLSPAPLANLITLGRQATSTRGNAQETAAWVRTKSIHSLIVVTAWYHMPRALTELRRAIPGVELEPVPVEPEGAQGWLGASRLLVEEYAKYVAATLDLTALAPERVPAAPRSAHP
jgi:uncharacterized SAM-binding protein YcdF (DUF218 family)